IRVPLESMRDVEWPLRPPGFLIIPRLDTLIRDATETWILNHIEIHEGDKLLEQGRITGARVSLPSDRSFESFDAAASNIRGAPLDSALELARQNSMLDVLLEYPITSDSARFSIDPQLARLGVRTTTVLHFLPPGRAERVYEYRGDPGIVRLDPR